MFSQFDHELRRDWATSLATPWLGKLLIGYFLRVDHMSDLLNDVSLECHFEIIDGDDFFEFLEMRIGVSIDDLLDGEGLVAKKLSEEASIFMKFFDDIENQVVKDELSILNQILEDEGKLRTKLKNSLGQLDEKLKNQLGDKSYKDSFMILSDAKQNLNKKSDDIKEALDSFIDGENGERYFALVEMLGINDPVLRVCDE